MEKLKIKINWKMLLGIALIIVLGIECIVIGNLSKKISYLEGEISSLHTQGGYIRGEISSIYDNIEEKLNREASLISSVDYELGAFNSTTQKAEVKFTVVPKNITDEMVLSISMGDETADFLREGNEFTATLNVSLFLNHSSYPILTVKTAEETLTEKLENVNLGSLYQRGLPNIQANIWGGTTTKKSSLKIDGNVSLDCTPGKESKISFKKIELVTELNKKEVDREVIFLKLVDGECEHSIHETYELDDGDNLVMYVEAKDTAGFVYRTGWHSWTEGDNIERYGKEIYDKDGNLLIFE